jgi:prepilin-type N-terminal cleavage/methylation domain-containing protein
VSALVTATSFQSEDGFTLVEVLLVSVLMLVVLGATLTTFNQFERTVKTNDMQNQAQEQARRGMDLMARDLRNLASPTPDEPEAVETHAPFDVIFQSEGKDKPAGSLNAQNTTRVRYCVNAAEGVLYRQIQTWTTELAPPAPASVCGNTASWTRTMPVAEHVVNDTRPVFTYNAAVANEITEVSSLLFVDANPGVRPKEVSLQSTVYLRNQNRAPTALFSWAATEGPGDIDYIFLNASASTDPEERPMTYHWYDMSLPLDGSLPDPRESQKIGEGIVFTYEPPAAGRRDIYLIVRDAALETESDHEEVCAPGPGETC